ncbi:hypothetical protein PVK06_020206 [Gossypium arboreum]|uniref:DUF4219 domain-containing protein n=1 Tax=Gossypium arboreum TaxID=29729 RepID=A0ABR0PM59_GOSAR|nr:hypothetical protein PVK06_020206 [Gossypium arboreum]
MSSSGFSPAPPLVFNGEGYHIWVVKMKTYLQAFNLWEVVNSDVEPAPFRANLTVAQIKQHSDERTKRHKATSCIQNNVSDVIFTSIMACESPKQAWDKLKEKFQGTERTRQQQLLNLRRDFENLKMKEEETVKYEAKISSLEDSRDLTSISLTMLINALYAQEQRRANKLQKHQKGAFQAKNRPASNSSTYKGKKTWSNEPKVDGAGRYPSCPHCKRLSHPGEVCWFKPDVQCKFCKNVGYVEKFYRNKGKQRQNQPQQPRAEAQVAEEESDQEERVFAVSCSSTKRKATKGWLIDSSCTNHMLQISFVVDMPQRQSPRGTHQVRPSSSDLDPLHHRPITDCNSPKLGNRRSPRGAPQSDQLNQKKLGTLEIAKKETQQELENKTKKPKARETVEVNEKVSPKKTRDSKKSDCSIRDEVSEDFVTDQTEADQNGPEMGIDDEQVRGTRPLAEIYERTQEESLKAKFEVSLKMNELMEAGAGASADVKYETPGIRTFIFPSFCWM